MNWLFKIIHLILDHKSEGEASPTSVRVARYTTVAAIVGSLATIFPVIWEKPPWWLHQPQVKQTATAVSTDDAGLAKAVVASVSAPQPLVPTILWWVAGVGLASAVYEIYARRKHHQSKMSAPDRSAPRSKVLPE
jgi:hypothetical protein